MEKNFTAMDASKHPDEETLIAYIRGELTGDSCDRTEKHLTNCSACLEIVAVLNPVFMENKQSRFHQLYTPPTQEEIDRFAEIAVRQIPSPPEEEPGRKRVADFFTVAGKPVVALPIAAILLIGIGVFFMQQREEPLEMIAGRLKKQITLYHGDVRLSGGYKSRAVSQLMSSAGPEHAFTDLASRLEPIAATGSPRARHLLAQLYTAEGRYRPADSLYALLAPTQEAEAALLVDQGALAFLKGDYDRAAEFFTQALHISPENPEALFNMARTEEKRGRIKSALHFYSQYLEHDKESDWSLTARNSIRLLQKNK